MSEYKYGNICFDCKNAVPDKRGHGCPWSRKFEPVPGWTAEPVILNQGSRYTETETFRITACPLFDPDDDYDASKCGIIPVRCIETGVVFKSIAAADRALGGDARRIANALRSPRGYAYGYHWEKVEK